MNVADKIQKDGKFLKSAFEITQTLSKRGNILWISYENSCILKKITVKKICYSNKKFKEKCIFWTTTKKGIILKFVVL